MSNQKNTVSVDLVAMEVKQPEALHTEEQQQRKIAKAARKAARKRIREEAEAAEKAAEEAAAAQEAAEEAAEEEAFRNRICDNCQEPEEPEDEETEHGGDPNNIEPCQQPGCNYQLHRFCVDEHHRSCHRNVKKRKPYNPGALTGEDVFNLILQEHVKTSCWTKENDTL